MNNQLYLTPSRKGIAGFPWQTCSMCNKTCHSVEPLPSATQTDYPNIPDGELLEYCHEQIQSQNKGRFAGGEKNPWKISTTFPSVSKFPCYDSYLTGE